MSPLLGYPALTFEIIAKCSVSVFLLVEFFKAIHLLTENLTKREFFTTCRLLKLEHLC